MINIAIVDDEELILKSIHKKIDMYLKSLNIEYEIRDYTNSAIALDEIKNNEFDIIFLDIDMPDISGMDIAQKLRMYGENVEIVFITNKDELVYNAIKFSPFRFIRKTRFDDEIQEALTKLIDKLNNSNSIYVFSTPNGKKTIQPIRITYIEVSSHKLNVHLQNDFFIANGNLKDIEDYFYTYGFIKIHQSYIVNYRYINFIRRNEVILDDGSVLPLSRSRYEETKLEYMRFSRENWK